MGPVLFISSKHTRMHMCPLINRWKSRRLKLNMEVNNAGFNYEKILRTFRIYMSVSSQTKLINNILASLVKFLVGYLLF